MKAIQTKYLGATNFKGSRIVARAEGVKPLTIGYPHEALMGEGAHMVAAQALATRLGWLEAGKYRLVGGELPDGTYAFVLVREAD